MIYLEMLAWLIIFVSYAKILLVVGFEFWPIHCYSRRREDCWCYELSSASIHTEYAGRVSPVCVSFFIIVWPVHLLVLLVSLAYLGIFRLLASVINGCITLNFVGWIKAKARNNLKGGFSEEPEPEPAFLFNNYEKGE